LYGFKIPLGKDNYMNAIYWDLENHSTPHILTCGATGSGKSVFLKSIIEYAIAAGIQKIFILDPKFEFTGYSSKGIEVHNDIEDIEIVMELIVEEMNDRVKYGGKMKTMVIFDEFADALANSRKAKEVKREGRKTLEENLRLLLQKGRSSGYRVVAATQRASVKVITGDAKVNFPIQVCFRVPKEADSRVVLDESGAEALTGMGDALIKSPSYPDTVRFQAYYKP